MDQYISAYLIKLRRCHPFFATLSLHMEYQFTENINKFETNGRQAKINPQYFSRLNADERVGTLLHLTLHSALLHPFRCGMRIVGIWNIAADIVVNQMVVESKFTVPPETAADPRYADCSVEFVYAKLFERTKRLVAMNSNNKVEANKAPSGRAQQLVGEAKSSSLMSVDRIKDSQQSTENCQQDLIRALQIIYPSVSDIQPSNRQQNPATDIEQKKIESHWKNALLQAQAVEHMSHPLQGFLPARLNRAIAETLHPKMDWRTILWRFMTKTPCDYSGYDRRLIHQGLYLDHLEGESLVVHIAIDTSGSIEDDQLAQFRAEVESIVRCYPITGNLYFVDAEVYGPYPLTQSMRIVAAEGGGGTDFSIFFKTLEKNVGPFEDSLCIYLTDGYGTFPAKPPPMPMLWVATDNAIDHFPFGEVAQLI